MNDKDEKAAGFASQMQRVTQAPAAAAAPAATTGAEAQGAKAADDAAPAEVSEPDVTNIIKDHVIASMGVGVVPVPVFDLVAIVGIQVRMMAKISELHGVTLSEDVARKAIMGLIGGVIPVSLGASAASLVKAVPGLGGLPGAAGVVILGGASTYAVGRLYADHLANGESVDTLSGEAVKERFKSLLEQGKTFVANLRKSEKDEEAAKTPEPAAS